MNCEAVLLFEIADPTRHRVDVADEYAFALRSREPVNWSEVNSAIVERWSKSALIWIKREAWKIVEGWSK